MTATALRLVSSGQRETPAQAAIQSQAGNERGAWLLRLEDGEALAIARQQVIEYVANVVSRWVPDCHPRCSRILLWRNQVLPLLGVAKGAHSHHAHVLIIGYLDSARADITHRIALGLQQPPLDINVRDLDQCAPAAEQALYWRGAIAACFAHQGAAVPIVNFNQLGDA